MRFIDLPSELLDAILNYLSAEGDLAALKACSLTCKTLLPVSQAYLFFKVTQECEDPRILQILETRPQIRPFVKHLNFIELGAPWIQDSETTRALFRLLSPHIRSIRIVQTRAEPTIPRFDLSSVSILNLVEAIFLKEVVRGPGYQTIQYGNTELATFLNYFGGLRALTFDGCAVLNLPAESPSSIVPPRFVLDTLDVQRCFDVVVLEWIIPALWSLRKLYFSFESCRPGINRFAERLAVSSNGALRHLELRDDFLVKESELQALMISVRRCNPNLESLTFSRIWAVPEDPMNRFLGSLRALQTHPRLRALTLIFRPKDCLDLVACEELQNLLLGREFPAFGRFSIHILRRQEESLQVTSELYRSSFSAFAGRRMLSIVAIDKEDRRAFMAGVPGASGWYLPH